MQIKLQETASWKSEPLASGPMTPNHDVIF